MKVSNVNDREALKTMHNAGRGALWVPLIILLLAAPLQAAVNATADRSQVAMGDTVRLTLTTTGDEDLSAVNLAPLHTDFDILRRSTASNTSIVNGVRNHTRKLIIDLAPRRQGKLQIPALRAGRALTQPLAIKVVAAADVPTGDQVVVFDATVDRSTVYVQGQVVLTLRLQQAVNLDNLNISELQLDDGFVKPLEQKSYQRSAGGRTWLVHELRYAIFPEHSGTVVIPSQLFSAREARARRSFFDLDSGGREITRRSKPLEVTVLPQPRSFPSKTWLPARKLTIEESWSTPPEQLRVGESTTRTITVNGESLQAVQLPPVLFPATEGLKYYPDQPNITDTETATGLRGTRVDSAALVPTRAGHWSIPEIRIPWWDTDAEKTRYAVLPAREINVSAATSATPPAQAVTAALPTSTKAAATSITRADIAGPVPDNALPWQILSAITSVGWLGTALYLLWSRRRRHTPPASERKNQRHRRSLKTLLRACAENDANAARSAVIEWASTLYPGQHINSLAQVTGLMGDATLSTALEALNAGLYSAQAAGWRGDRLADAVKRLAAQKGTGSGGVSQDLQLYPSAPG